MKPVVTVAQLARETGYRTATLKKLIRLGLIKAYLHNGRLYTLDWKYAERIAPLLRLRIYLHASLACDKRKAA